MGSDNQVLFLPALRLSYIHYVMVNKCKQAITNTHNQIIKLKRFCFNVQVAPIFILKIAVEEKLRLENFLSLQIYHVIEMSIQLHFHILYTV